MVLSTLDALAYTPLVALGLLAKMKAETHAAYAAMAAVVITTDFIDTADVAAVTTALGATLSAQLMNLRFSESIPASMAFTR